MRYTNLEKKSFFVIAVILFVLSFASNIKAQSKEVTEGSLEVMDGAGKKIGLCPLKRTDVKAEISGFIARVTVTQEFTNPFDRKIEAVYAFPLSQGAAVDDMTMIIGDRIVRGRIMKSEEATATYNEAKAQGKVASLLQQQRPDIFTQSVANILPNAEIRIVISYVQYLKYDSGSYEFDFPMTIAERYIPMSQTSDEETSKISAPRAARPGHTISLEMKIDAGVPLIALESVNHKIVSNAVDATESFVRLENQNDIPNKDFVLRYRVAGEKIQDALLMHRDKRGGFFTMILQPPDRVMPQDVNPKEIVFVLDTSGSMEGFPIEKAKESMNLALNGLYPNDTFNLITFAGDTEILFDKPVPASRENLAKARKFLESRSGNGGTEMMKAIKAALDPSDSQHHVRIVCFMTDGQVGNENEIINEVKNHPKARVFSFGIGSSVNHYLLDKMAQEGRGEVEYVSLNDDGSAAARRFHERIRNPLLADVAVDWSGMPVADIYPQRIPDLFSAKPVVLSGRFTQSGKGVIRLKGMMAGVYYEREIQVEFPEEESSHDVLATLWARQRVEELMTQNYAGTQNEKTKDELKNEITQLGIEFRLLTQFTSFVAVDESSDTGADVAEKVEVPTAEVDSLPINGRSMSAFVSVTGAAETVNTQNATVGTTVTNNVIANMPLASRDALNLVMTLPGAASSGRPRTSTVNGPPKGALNVTLDGVNIQDNLLESADGFFAYVRPRTDGTSEVAVLTGSLSAQNSGSGAMQVNIVTKSGTNGFHGSLFDDFGNGVLNANSSFANSRNLRRPSSKLNLFGGTLGGPIQKDKHFFFVAYENSQMRQSDFALTEVPSLTSRSNAPANVQSLFRAFPLPNGANTRNGFSEFASNFLNPVSQNSLTFRYDWNVSEKLNFSTRYLFSDSERTTRGEDGFSLNTLNRRNKNANMIKGEFRYLPSNSLVTEMSVDYSRASLGQSFSLDNFGGANVANAQSLFAGNQTFTRLDLFGKNAVIASGQETKDGLQKVEIKNNWSTFSGVHSFDFGYGFRHQWFTVGSQPTERSVLFAGATNSNAERDNLFTRIPKLHPRFSAFSSYFNDSWRVTPRLTLNLGLRWEVASPPSNNDDVKPLALNNSNPSSNINFAPVGTLLWNTTYNNFSPRVSFAWDITGDSKTVLRAGFGLYYETDNTENVFQAFKNSFPFVNGTVAFNQPFFASGNPLTANNLFVGFDPKLKLPYTMRWTLGLEREISYNSVLGFDYIGSQGNRFYLTRTLADRIPNFPLVRFTNNDGESNYQALVVRFNHRFSKGFAADVNYTFAKSIDNYSPDKPFAAFVVSDNPDKDRGVSDFDIRHSFKGSLSYSTPNEATGKWYSFLTRRWTLSSLFDLRTALPMNVVYARVNNFGVSYFRPDLLAGAALYSSDANIGGEQRINANAFAIPGNGQGTLGRNSLRGFPHYQFDFALSRRFSLTQSLNLTLKVSAINAFNHPNYAAPSGTDVSIGSRFPSGLFLSNPTFGQSTTLTGSSTSASMSSLYQQNGARSLQVSFKLDF